MMKQFTTLLVLALAAISCARDSKVFAEPTTAVFAEPSTGGSMSKNQATKTPPAQPEELGIVSWSRDLDEATKEAKAKNLPLLVLFDEVPGCSTVLGFGNEVLSHPMIADAIENYFVPVAIYNNVSGKDAEILATFGEPSWNNPIVRIMDASHHDLAKRYSGDYHVESFAALLQQAIEATGRKAPLYLRALTETNPKSETALFSMYCFWSGEAAFGAIDGVTNTRTGFVNGREAVEVTYDPSRLSYASLASTAKQHDTSPIEGKLSPSTSDDKYQLRHTAWWFVPMSSWQAMRANSLLADGKSPEEVFSPRQRALYQKRSGQKISAQPAYIGDALAEAFQNY
jgi:hypothetical protein